MIESIILSAFMLNIILNYIMLSVVMLSVMAKWEMSLPLESLG